MTDPLGQSQVLPYLRALSEAGHAISLLSCEKPAAFAREGGKIRRLCEAAAISWHPMPYYRKPPGLASLWQLRQLFKAASRLHRKQAFDLVHCRSYLPAWVGLQLKKRFGLPYLFDMRGFWVDEKVEGGIWNLRNPLYRFAYTFLKRKEKKLLAEATAIVSLTHRARQILQDMSPPPPGPIRVIPCSVDLELFSGREDLRPRAREGLGLRTDQLLIGYLGSVGTWYLLPEMLDFFRLLLEKKPSARFLLLTPGDPAYIGAAARKAGVPTDKLIIRRAAREEVPGLLSACDLGLCLIRPTFSKQASSPTKLGEMLAMGLPVLANAGVGDLDAFFEKYPEAGLMVPEASGPYWQQALDHLPEMLNGKPEKRRELASQHFSLTHAAREYDAIYQQLFEAKES